MSTYESVLKSWALTGQHAYTESNKPVNNKIRDDLQLIGAQIYFRHGARTPLSLLPGLDEVSYSKEQVEAYAPSKWDVKLIRKIGNKIVSEGEISSANDIIRDRIKPLKAAPGVDVVTGQLTGVGEKQLYTLGQSIRKQLIEQENNGLLPNIYDPNIVYCRSTYMNRTISSARSFLAGLFSSEEHSDQILAKGPFEIEVNNFLYEDMFPNPRAFPVLTQCPTAVKLYESLDDNNDLKKARQALIDRIGALNYSFGIIELGDEFASRKAHGFAIPNDFAELTKDFDVMSAREFVAMSTSIGLDLMVRSTCGSLLYLMKQNFDSILNNYISAKEKNIQTDYQRFFVYSGHDTTIIPLAMALEIFAMQWPDYAAYILMKYYVSKTNPNEAFVLVDYNGEPKILPNCDSYYCSYSTFLKNLENRFEKPKLLQDD